MFEVWLKFLLCVCHFSTYDQQMTFVQNSGVKGSRQESHTINISNETGCLRYIHSCELWHEENLYIYYTVICWYGSLFQKQTAILFTELFSLCFSKCITALFYKPGGLGGLHLLFSDIGWQPLRLHHQKASTVTSTWRESCHRNIQRIYHYCVAVAMKMLQLYEHPRTRLHGSKLTEKVNKVGKIFASEILVSEVVLFFSWALLILRPPDVTMKMTAIHISEWGCKIWDEWSLTTHRGNHSKEKCKVKARKVQLLTKTSFKMCFCISPIQQDLKDKFDLLSGVQNHCRIKSQMGKSDASIMSEQKRVKLPT